MFMNVRKSDISIITENRENDMKQDENESSHVVAVTGVLGYSGRYMAREIAKGACKVLGLTNSPDKPNPDGWRLHPLCWDDPDALTEGLRGCRALINTYWVRFNTRWFSHAQAVERTKVLFEAARRAGVKRIVHVSITCPDAGSRLSYFRGKAVLEKELEGLGVPYSVLRPAVLFGEKPGEDILINNMAWVLRHVPVVGVPGNGEYRLRPIHVQDLAAVAVREALREDGENSVIEAVGPETYTFRELFCMLGRVTGRRRPVLSVPPWAAYAAACIMGVFHRDVMLTRDEIRGLMEDRLHVEGAAPAGSIRLSAWAEKHAAELGRSYACEMARRTCQ